LGNFKLCGVLLAYANDRMVQMLKTAMGWNMASTHLGASITGKIIGLVLQQRIRPVIGKVVTFDEIPVAIEAMPHRDTVGRAIVKRY